MSTYNTLLSIFSIGVLLYCGSLIGDKHELENQVNEKELVIVKLEDKIVQQESEIRILSEDVNSKRVAIAALEEKIQKASDSSHETIENLIELSRIVPFTKELVQSVGPRNNEQPVEKKENDAMQESIPNSGTPNPAAKKENKSKDAGVVDEAASKKFINLRNNIYNRYK